jgi:hypothetical protein
MEIVTLNTTDHQLDGLIYQQLSTPTTLIHVITYDQLHAHLKLVLSKASEALQPGVHGNQVGEGGTLHQLIQSQPDLRFTINGTYNHYRKGFYPWHHDDYAVGDPVGLVKIREHLYNDNPHQECNGYLQRLPDKTWVIADEPNMSGKYILSSRPLLIHNREPIMLPLHEMEPLEVGSVNPPSFLNHGLQHHARTAVGSRGTELVFLIAESQETEGSTGLTLPELQEVGTHLRLDSLLNLDGGGSSRFWLRTEEDKYLMNSTASEDENRVLGNILMLFSTNS